MNRGRRNAHAKKSTFAPSARRMNIPLFTKYVMDVVIDTYEKLSGSTDWPDSTWP